MARVYEDEHVLIEMLGPLGPYENNAYIVRPVDGGPVVVVDAPEGSEETVRALGDAEVSHIVVTHSHADHWNGFEALRARTIAPVYSSEDETGLDPSRHVLPLSDGAEVRVGRTTMRIIHTPGHTPGSICLLVGGALLTGDTLFPGGPGHSRSPEALREEIESITSKLYVLPDDTMVLPGHGGGTTIGASKAEYEQFASRPHPDDLHGDVLWLES
jgi:glyoxylase-like metal-dependent hydrolase (beta-lactamase superfamily II)